MMNPNSNKRLTRMRTRQMRLPDIPGAIILDILTYLPVKSLCRFKCVSRPWLYMITAPGFVIKHTDQRSRLMFADKKHKCFYSFSIDDYYLGRTVEFETLHFQHGRGKNTQVFLVACCRDLALFKLYVGKNGLPELYVGNPATRECWELPMPYDQLEMEYDNDEHNAEQPFGFGYVSSLQDYKVVSLCSSGEAEGHTIQFSVCILGTGVWELSGVALNYRLQCCWDGILLNGGLHWFVGFGFDEEDEVVEDEDDERCVILCFNLETQNVTEIPVPAYHCFQAENFHVGLFQGQLCITHSNLRKDGNEFWVMREYGVQNSWTKIVISGGVHENFVPTCYQVQRSGDDLWIRNGQFVTCNLDDDEVNFISRSEISSQHHVSCQVGFYVESLYSLDHVPEIEE